MSSHDKCDVWASMDFVFEQYRKKMRQSLPLTDINHLSNYFSVLCKLVLFETISQEWALLHWWYYGTFMGMRCSETDFSTYTVHITTMKEAFYRQAAKQMYEPTVHEFYRVAPDGLPTGIDFCQFILQYS